MKMKKYTVQLITLLSVGLPALAVASPPLCTTPPCEDSTAVSSLLLAAGMYGGMDTLGSELSLTRSVSSFKSLSNVQGPLEGQDITLSYEGSSGSRLGFSAGYLYATPEEKQEAGTVLLDIDKFSGQQSSLLASNENTTPWYLTFNFAKDFQVSDNLAIGLASKATLLTLTPSNSLTEAENNRAVCMSFNLPVSYGDSFTITPELQWSRSLELGQQETAGSNSTATTAADKDTDTIYGGMSITFSY
jgi:hypothetical protein